MRYEIHKNVWGEWVIIDLELDDEIARFLTEEQAREYLNFDKED